MSLRGNTNSKNRKCDPKDVEYVSISTAELDTFSIVWSIHNFSGLTDDVELDSPIYRGGPRTSHSWQLCVEPNAMDTADPNDEKKYLSVYLTLTKIRGLNPEKQKKSVKASYDITLLDGAGKPAKSIPTNFGQPNEYTEGGSWGYRMQMTLFNAAEVLFDDRLTIHCRVSIHLDFEHRIVPGGHVPVPLTKEALDVQVFKQLQIDFKKGFETGAFTDMTLVTKTKTFKAHTFVLAARSTVFKVMLSSGMLEATQSSVVIQDFDEETVESMLRYVYAGEIGELSTDQACDLLRMADKYEVLGLKEYLEEVLLHKLKTSNVLKVLAISEMYGASRLKTTALQFANMYKGILRQTEGFKELIRAHPNLLNELYQLV